MTNHQAVEEALDAMARHRYNPAAIALLDRCVECDSRSADLRRGRCPACVADAYELLDAEAEDRVRERGARIRVAAEAAELSYPAARMDRRAS